jgi:hypothetical protein
MFMLTTVKFDGVVTGVTWLANNAGVAVRRSGRCYRLSGSTYTLVDSQVVTVIPADNTVAVLPLYLSVTRRKIFWYFQLRSVSTVW